MPLTSLGTISVDHPGSGSREVEAFQGSVTDMPGHPVDFLVVSALPNDYAPIPGSLIGALDSAGVSVAALAANKAVDYRPKMPCWISQPIGPNPNPGITFQRILVYEPANPSTTAARMLIDVFRAIKCFAGGQATSVAMPLVSTGSGGADYREIFRMSICQGLHFAGRQDLDLTKVHVVNYNGGWQSHVQSDFDAIKGNYNALGSNSNPHMPGAYSMYAAKALAHTPVITTPTPKQSFAITLYTTNYYGVINSPLYASPPNLSDPAYIQLQPYYALLDAALANVAPSAAAQVYRGISSGIPPSVINPYKTVGNEILTGSYTSTSENKKVACGFAAGAYFLTYQTHPTAKGIKQFSVYTGEDEALFGRDMTAKVAVANCPGSGVCGGGTSLICDFTLDEVVINFCS